MMRSMLGMQIARQYWWVPLVRGIIAILFGLAIFFWPGPATVALILLFGFFALLDGILAIIASIQERKTEQYWWMILVGGILGVLVGLGTFVWPGITALTLFYLIAIWAIITGVMEIAAAFSLSHVVASEWVLVTIGVLAILLGVMLLFMPPLLGIMTLVYAIAIYALISGIIWIIRSFQFRSLPAIMDA